ncbi:MAG TPA: SDR family oxidoreductase [Mycobacteriales bacterium]|nr:SDR family oxidoreductase [Mycobacteriales bacterium]
MTRTAIVTGAGGGVGTVVCTRLRAEGYHVLGLDKVSAPTADEWIEVDLAQLDVVAEVGQRANAEHEVCLVVHNAAVQPLGGVGELAPSVWEETFRVNVLAGDVLVGATLERLKALRGSVVVISSVHGRESTPGIAAYATTKAALEGWVRAASLDLAPEIRVNSIVPGALSTPKLLEGFQRWGEQAAETRMQRLLDRTPLGVVGAPEDVAEAVVYLASDRARFMTGASMVIDGGATVCLASE